MIECEDCGKRCKSPAGLTSHRRAAHPVGMSAVSMVDAMEKTIDELRRLGRFEDVDAARVQSLRSMAAALDANPFNSQMWRELRETLDGVMKADDDADDALAAALAQIGSGTEVGNPETS